MRIKKVINNNILCAIDEKGIEFSNPLSGPIMCYYPEEYRIGKHCLKIIEEKCNILLNPDEAAFIALHIVNAKLNTNKG